MSADDRGVAFWREPDKPNEVFLVVEGGRVIDCTPYAKRWAMGKTAAQLLNRGQRIGARVEWVPLNSVPTRVQPHLVPHIRLRRWRREGDRGIVSHLEFSQAGENWIVHDTRDRFAWLHQDREDAMTDLRRRLGRDTWTRIHASADLPGRPMSDLELSAEWGVPD
jgi:hypothetical protein